MRTRIGVGIAVALCALLALGSAAIAQEQKLGMGKAEDGKWLMLCYWELNSDMAVMEHTSIAKKLSESGLFPPKGVRILRFDKTAEDWGMLLYEADDPKAVFEMVNLWKISGTGFFKELRVSPAMPVRDASMLNAQIFQAIQGAAPAK